MNLKFLSAALAILLSHTVSAQTSAGIEAYNSGSVVGREYMNAGYIRSPNAEEVNRDLRAAKLGDATAQFKMALRYDSGHGVPEDPAVSVEWLRKAAEQNFSEAQYNLGCMYDSGRGVSQDHAEAAIWLRKAAENGYASAQKNLGAKYGNGQGVPQSHVEAYVWSSIAALSGDEGAKNNRNIAANMLSQEDLALAQKRIERLNGEIQQRAAAN